MSENIKTVDKILESYTAKVMKNRKKHILVIDEKEGKQKLMPIQGLYQVLLQIEDVVMLDVKGL